MPENHQQQQGVPYFYSQYNYPQLASDSTLSYQANPGPPQGVPNSQTPSHGYAKHDPNSYRDPPPVAPNSAQSHGSYPPSQYLPAASYHQQQAYQTQGPSPNSASFRHSSSYNSYPPTASPYQTESPAIAPIQSAYSVAYNAPSPSKSYLTPTGSAPASYGSPHSPQMLPQQQYPTSSNTNYLTPAFPNNPQYANTQQQRQPQYQYGSITPVNTFYLTNTSPANSTTTALPPNASPNIELSRLTLNGAQVNNSKLEHHWATCDGCGAHPLEGYCWRCLVCTDYDLCQPCREDKIHSHHQFECIHFPCETHQGSCCHSCPGAVMGAQSVQ